ncbi:MAG: hypothetical protein MUE36_12760 [Acidimicrobiales bacterium]|nr:hypothetical protein [Acidimicrobiales bacterium]
MSDLPPPPDPPERALATTPTHHPARHVELSDLPPALADRLRFESAAPRRLRNDALPPEVRQELAQLWDGIVADVYDEVTGLKRRTAFSRDRVDRVLDRVGNRFLQAQRVVIVAAVQKPLAGDADWRHIAAGGAGGAAAAAAQEVAAYGTMGAATTTAIVAAIAGEVLETYVAASARVQQYRQARRSPDTGLVITDLAEAAGYGDAMGRRASNHVARDAARWLGGALLKRTGRRFARALLPVVGVAVGGTMSALSVRKVTRLPLRPPAEDEVIRLAGDLGRDDRSLP